MLAMRRRELQLLERRSERTAAALNFIGVLASRVGLQALLQKSPPKWIRAECRKAVVSCTEMARGVGGAPGDHDAAQEHLGHLEDALARGDLLGLQQHAAAALGALGFGVTSAKARRAPPRSRASKGGAPSRERKKKSRL